MRKEIIKTFLFIFTLTAILCACNDPVFYVISQEVKPIPPRIRGVPTNFVVYDDRMFVAAGKTVYTYQKGTEKPYWSTETNPGGNIMNLASTGNTNNLYALCSTDNNNDGRTVIKKFKKDDSSWETLAGDLNTYPKIHNIYAAGTTLFIFASAPTTTSAKIDYAILYIENSSPDTAKKLTLPSEVGQENAGEMTGAAYDNTHYYLSIRNKGVYVISNLNAAATLISNVDNFSGIINLKNSANTIVMISRSGVLYTVNSTSITSTNLSLGGKLATGTLAIYEKPPETGNTPSANPERLLLAGRQDSLSYSYTYGYTYGYLEVELDAGGIKTGSNFTEPGRSEPSTVRPGGNERYQSTIGKLPVNYIFQAPYSIDENMTLFASTQKNGVWSYRDRSGLWQWNAEGENEP